MITTPNPVFLSEPLSSRFSTCLLEWSRYLGSFFTCMYFLELRLRRFWGVLCLFFVFFSLASTFLSLSMAGAFGVWFWVHGRSIVIIWSFLLLFCHDATMTEIWWVLALMLVRLSISISCTILLWVFKKRMKGNSI